MFNVSSKLLLLWCLIFWESGWFYRRFVKNSKPLDTYQESIAMPIAGWKASANSQLLLGSQNSKFLRVMNTNESVSGGLQRASWSCWSFLKKNVIVMLPQLSWSCWLRKPHLFDRLYHLRLPKWYVCVFSIFFLKLSEPLMDERWLRDCVTESGELFIRRPGMRLCGLHFQFPTVLWKHKLALA